MIHELVRSLRAPGARRFVAAVALLAFVVVLVAGAAHAAEAATGHDGDGCSICVAFLANAAASVPATSVTLAAPVADRPATGPARAPLLEFDAARIAAPRGPPAVA